MSVKRLVAALVAFAGAAAFTACLLGLVSGMQDVVKTDAGYGPRRGVPRSRPCLRGALCGTVAAGHASKQP